MGREFSNNELSFALKSLKEGLRLDSRDESAYRKISVITGPVYGHSEARIGKTKYVH